MLKPAGLEVLFRPRRFELQNSASRQRGRCITSKDDRFLLPFPSVLCVHLGLRLRAYSYLSLRCYSPQTVSTDPCAETPHPLDILDYDRKYYARSPVAFEEAR
jgi:hypothetical protein